MTSAEALKTNEFLRRRKLRIQQVREQSKEIAKKIRQRAKVEKFRLIADLDEKKQKEYFQQQDKLVKKLEHYYASGLRNVGAAHTSASEVNLQDDIPEKPDLSKRRGKEAAAELKRRKQDKLDEQKKSLDRKLQARETANEISREKSSAVANKLLTKPSSKSIVEGDITLNAPDIATNDNKQCEQNDKPNAVRCDMATQWDSEELPNEWEPHIPKLSIPKDRDDQEPPNKLADKSERVKRLNLFALSDEMPSSLRGGLTSVPEEHIPVRSSLTLVSEYLRNRGLRLRESETTVPNKKSVEDLQSIKQTILRTRSSRTEGNCCHVTDVKVIPVPSWQAETKCVFCCHKLASHKHVEASRELKSVTNSQINQIFSSIRPVQHDMPTPTPVLRGSSPFRRNKCYQMFNRAAKGSTMDKSVKSSEPESALTKKSSMTMYNHSTRDTKDVPRSDKRLVIRDPQTEEDAYTRAMKESSETVKDREHQKKLQDMRNKIAMTKQNVEKEYKDTMAFLTSLPKNKSKPIKSAYMDDQRQQTHNENRQRKLQHEFRNVEKECRRHPHMNPKPSTSHDKSRSKSRSPTKFDSDDDFNAKDFQYSWMPVPESDGSLAIHTIPTTLKERKSGNTVKFSKVDSYHEYRSRHKHTPPTKDTATHEKQNKRVVQATVIDQSENDTTSEDSSISSDTSSVENLRLENKAKTREDQKLSDAERIIIYKILDSTNGKNKGKKQCKVLKDIAKSLSSIDKDKILKSLNSRDDEKVDKNKSPLKKMSKTAATGISFEQLNEGVYKTVNEKGDNISSLYFADSPREGEDIARLNERSNPDRPCVCGKTMDKELQGTGVNWDSGDEPADTRVQPVTSEPRKCFCGSGTTAKQNDNNKPIIQPSEATSTTSFKSAMTDKTILPDSGFIKLLNEGGHEAGKFYVGASGFLQDNAYEVVIQLRKKDGAKEERKETELQATEENPASVKERDVDVGATPITVDPRSRNEEIRDNFGVESRSDMGIHILPPQNFLSQESVKLNVTSQDRVQNSNADNPLPNNEISDKTLPPGERTQVNLVDKSVHTTSHLSGASMTLTKSAESIPRPATSTYTQTTLRSPDRRPILHHMSSSTSTAYMSPPDMILPYFLKNNYKVSFDELYDQNAQDRRIEFTDSQEHCEKFAGCECRRCTRTRKVLNKSRSPPWSKLASSARTKHVDSREKTPSNTRRDNTGRHETLSPECGKKKELRSTSPAPKKVKCSKHESPNASKTCLKIHTHKSKRKLAANRHPSHIMMRINTNRSASQSGKTINKNTLNPVIKSYVDKLLALNTESLKAIDVMNQDCSSATTPGSSIIHEPQNINKNKLELENKISLEQIKEILTQQILENLEKEHNNAQHSDTALTEGHRGRSVYRLPKKKSLHKVKSVYVSKHLLNKSDRVHMSVPVNSVAVSTSSSTNLETNNKRPTSHIPPAKSRSRSKSSPSPRNSNYKTRNQTKYFEPRDSVKIGTVKENKNYVKSDSEVPSSFVDYRAKSDLGQQCGRSLPSRREIATTSESDYNSYAPHPQRRVPLSTSTQTSRMIDDEIKFMKLAEDKLQNMEKIADLTEKCTKRLSNLAKVLEEVRKNKSLAYSQVSDSASDSERKSERNAVPGKPRSPPHNDPLTDMREEIVDESSKAIVDREDDTVFSIRRDTDVENSKPKSTIGQRKSPTQFDDFMTELRRKKLDDSRKSPTKLYSPIEARTEGLHEDQGTNENSAQIEQIHSFDKLPETLVDKTPPRLPTQGTECEKEIVTSDSSDYVPFLADIPKPEVSKTKIGDTEITSPNDIPEKHPNVKNRDKPPPALSRLNFKRGQDLVPHELSTVLEVDSPLSVKLKNQSTANTPDQVTSFNNETKGDRESTSVNKELQENPDLLQSNIKLSRRPTKISSMDSSDDSKIQMMDLKQFNEIMLKPFMSLQEYAKQYNVQLDDVSNMDDIPKDDANTDDLSSLHSEGSLPDVIAELLKRKIISEPFKFESGSNVNSTTVSSESTLSMLALSKVRKEKKKSSVLFHNKENIAETSDTLSISSNPDLENAFKKLGMGWACSTLKKTKERLALSSSSNTSSSSISQQFKLKSFSNQDIPIQASDSLSSVLHLSKRTADNSKNAEQQTSQMNSMTVKEFLTNELAKKITFTNKSYKDDTEEFISLYETRMPEQMKHLSQIPPEERSIETSNGNTRARTSTPVQIFKSLTYHSSSSSNRSNGLFSNADDLSSVKGTSNSMRNQSTSEKDDLTIPNYSLRMKKDMSDCSKSD